MIKNNFTRAPKGEPNIELSCFYDTDLSRWEFEENFKILQYSDYRKICKAYYIDNGNVPDETEISFTLKGEKSDIVKFLSDQIPYEKEEIETWDNDTLESEVLGNLSEHPTILNYETLNENDLDKTGLEITSSKKLECVAVCGYSQGDYAEVFYCPDDLEKAWGKKPDENDLQKMFKRLFYDAPIHCCFEIDGEEYDYSDLMPDNYEWDRAKFAEIVSKESGIEINTILDFLPEYPDYS